MVVKMLIFWVVMLKMEAGCSSKTLVSTYKVHAVLRPRRPTQKMKTYIFRSNNV